MIDKNNTESMFTPQNVVDFAQRKVGIMCTILAKIPGTKLNEYATIGVVTNIPLVYDTCVKMGGDAIEVWVVENGCGIMSERWEPTWFKEHFMEIFLVDDGNVSVELKMEEEKHPETPEEDEENEERHRETPTLDSGDERVVRSALACASSEAAMLNYTMREILDAEQLIAELLVSVSFATGHPIPLETLIAGLQHSVAKMLFALTYSKGGIIPKKRKSEFGKELPYWTKIQIQKARLNPEDEKGLLGSD